LHWDWSKGYLGIAKTTPNIVEGVGVIFLAIIDWLIWIKYWNSHYPMLSIH